ncbi:MAG: HAD family hydrolase [Pseudomonadales bacterium]|nr:HAD family hydrolase [Pseudomonadales bacterium]MCP5213773.1 HAD family hydrolase [Pseudomonadales bacterium]
MALAIFDLDNTLIAGDSDHAWGEFLVEKGVVDPAEYQQKNDYFYQQYQQGQMDIYEYINFAFSPLAANDIDQLNQWHQEFMREKIQPLFLPLSTALLERHRNQGDYLLIITSTNSFITAPICKLLGVDDFIATEPEMENGQYTGKLQGIPSYREGKITRLNAWLKDNNMSLENSYGYSDSINDMPLLEHVDNPIVVDGDPELIAEAQRRGWPCISLRE